MLDNLDKDFRRSLTQKTILAFSDGLEKERQAALSKFRAGVSHQAEKNPEDFVEQVLIFLTQGPRRDADQENYLIFSLVTSLFGVLKKQDKTEAIASLQSILQQLGPRHSGKPPYIMIEGAALMLAGKRQPAYECFARAALGVDHGHLSPKRFSGSRSIRAYSPKPEWMGKETASIFSPINWRPSESKGPIIVSAACDKEYFISLAPYVLESVKSCGSAADMHFHVVNWDSRCEATLVGMQQSNDREILISTEEYPYTKDFTYFATCRFSRVKETLARFNKPVYLTDMDNKLIGQVERGGDLLRYDFGVRLNSWNDWLPWLGPNAGSVFINNTPKGLLFARYLANYIHSRFTLNSSQSWYFDQLCLNEVVHVMQDVSGVKIRDLSRGHQYSAARPAKETQHLKAGR